MIVLDTTILVYAVGGEHALAPPCRRLVDAIGAGEVVATTTIEVLQEFAHVRARRRGREDAVRLTERFATLLGPPLQPQPGDLARGLALFAAHERIGAFDAVLAAAAMRVEAQALVSADGAFGVVPGLIHIDPAMPDFLDAVTRPR